MVSNLYMADLKKNSVLAESLECTFKAKCRLNVDMCTKPPTIRLFVETGKQDIDVHVRY